MKKDIKRIFLKISGEALAWVDDENNKESLNHETIKKIANDLIQLTKDWYQIALMTWAGNIFRGRNEWKWIDPAIGHYAGMLSTMVNALILQNILVQEWAEASVFSAIEMPRFIKTFNKISALNRMKQWKIIICAWWTWNPFCSTDLWSVTRALELDCDIVVKCTNVDGIYDADPRKNPDATRYETLTYQEALSKWLSVMDLAAFGMALENDIPTYVTQLWHPLTKLVASVGHG